mmetsp:Transcript_25835/g.80900  ORF Transcript_25835/g.80900 Transcript_25835/m.80900 type:complete len:206 (+) Transcript_25835:191-808(+)
MNASTSFALATWRIVRSIISRALGLSATSFLGDRERCSRRRRSSCTDRRGASPPGLGVRLDALDRLDRSESLGSSASCNPGRGGLFWRSAPPPDLCLLSPSSPGPRRPRRLRATAGRSKLLDKASSLGADAGGGSEDAGGVLEPRSDADGSDTEERGGDFEEEDRGDAGDRLPLSPRFASASPMRVPDDANPPPSPISVPEDSNP